MRNEFFYGRGLTTLSFLLIKPLSRIIMPSPNSSTASVLSPGRSSARASSSAEHKRRVELPDTPSIFPGLALAVALALCATLIGHWLPALGAAVSGILLGMVIRNTAGVKTVFQPGLRFGSSKILQWSIILLGFGLSLQQIAKTGATSLLGIGEIGRAH